MTLAELEERLQRRIVEADEMNSEARVGDVLRVVLSELTELDVSSVPGHMLDTRQAASVLGVKPKTIANWAAEGRFQGAEKTSGKKGKWIIPAEAVGNAKKYQRIKLWEP